VKKQKFDREDGRLLLRLMRENNFPQIWVPDPENRICDNCLWHRMVGADAHADHESVAALAMNEGYRGRKNYSANKGERS